MLPPVQWRPWVRQCRLPLQRHRLSQIPLPVLRIPPQRQRHLLWQQWRLRQVSPELLRLRHPMLGWPWATSSACWPRSARARSSQRASAEFTTSERSSPQIRSGPSGWRAAMRGSGPPTSRRFRRCVCWRRSSRRCRRIKQMLPPVQWRPWERQRRLPLQRRRISQIPLPVERSRRQQQRHLLWQQRQPRQVIPELLQLRRPMLG
mmetsp:Transcript_47816/g.154068  ORF Transcript_47816/g.154068 Transcript_47816/m.154068 type:complete len:205 (+) Transcript_47816:1539-2153(+)